MHSNQNMWCIILGSKTEDGTALRSWPDIEAALQKYDIAYSVRFAEYPGHAIRITDDAILKGYYQILGIGGASLERDIREGIANNKYIGPDAIVLQMLTF